MELIQYFASDGDLSTGSDVTASSADDDVVPDIPVKDEVFWNEYLSIICFIAGLYL